MKKFTKNGATIKQLKAGIFSVSYKSSLGTIWKTKLKTIEEVDSWLWNIVDNHDIYREINVRLNEVFEINENIKYIEDIRIIRLFNGDWYCLFNDFRTIRTSQMQGYSLYSFEEWCKKHKVIPINN